MTVDEAIAFLQGMVASDEEVGGLELLRDGLLVGDFLLFDDAVHVRTINRAAEEEQS
jgi:hypothetical protein